MNTFNLLAASSVFFALGCAQTPADGEADKAAVANVDGVVCSRISDKGSRLDRRVCTTKAERAEAARITREEVTNRQRVGTATDSSAPAGVGN